MSCYWMASASAGFEPLLVIAGISLDSSSVCPHSVLMLPPAHTVHMVNHTRDSQPHGKTYSILLRCVAKVVSCIALNRKDIPSENLLMDHKDKVFEIRQ